MQKRIRVPSGLPSSCAGQCRRGGKHCTPRRSLLAGGSAGAGQETSTSATASDERAEWAKSIRSLTGRVAQRVWAPQLDPPPVLADVAVVLVSPRRPASVGAVARAMSCFECVDLRVVEPRCDRLVRASRSASKGAQWLLWQAREYASLPDALEGVDASVAFTRWVGGRPSAFSSVEALLQERQLAARLRPRDLARAGAGGAAPGAAPKVALVFGREERGLEEGEVDACSMVCSIPIGRLHESLSLSHAVTIVLSQLFQRRGDLAFRPNQLVEGAGVEE